MKIGWLDFKIKGNKDENEK